MSSKETQSQEGRSVRITLPASRTIVCAVDVSDRLFTAELDRKDERGRWRFYRVGSEKSEYPKTGFFYYIQHSDGRWISGLGDQPILGSMSDRTPHLADTDAGADLLCTGQYWTIKPLKEKGMVYFDPHHNIYELDNQMLGFQPF